MEIIFPNKRRSSIEVSRPFDLFTCMCVCYQCMRINQLFAETRARASKELDSMRAREDKKYAKLSQAFIIRHELDKEELEKATYIKFERRSRI